MGSGVSCTSKSSVKVSESFDVKVKTTEDSTMSSSCETNETVAELLVKGAKSLGLEYYKQEESLTDNLEEGGEIVKEDKDKVSKNEVNTSKQSGEEEDKENGTSSAKKIVQLEPFTAEELENFKMETFKQMREIASKVMSCDPKMTEYGAFDVKIRNAVLHASKTYFALKRANNEEVNIFRKEVADILVETKFLDLVCEIVEYTYKHGWIDDTDLRKQATKYIPLSHSMLVLLNFSDASHELAIEIANKPQILQVLKTMVVDYTDRHLEKVEEKLLLTEQKLFKWAMSIIHNMSMADTNVNALREVGLINTLQPLLQSKNEIISISALASLSAIINEKECEIINGNKMTVMNLLDMLRKGQNDKKRRCHGWSCKECALTIKNLSRNDANKKLLVDLGALELLVNLGRNGSLEEQHESVQAIWALCFDEDNQNLITGNADLGVIELLMDLKKSDDMQIKRACNGALWTLKDALKNTVVEKYKLIGKQLALKREKSVQSNDMVLKPSKKKKKLSGLDSTQTDDKPSGGHIMISYQWSDQAILKDVRDNLKASGFKVWMDIDQMEGSTLQAMAEAVEGADVFLMCMSSKYKNSLPCRAEAEYAYQKKKKIIPLKMEKGYNPDGWLGFLLGAKLFYEFSGKYPFEKKMEELLKEMHSGKTNHDSTDAGEVIHPSTITVTHSSSPVVQQKTPVSSPATTGFNRLSVSMEKIVSVRKWKSADVSNWIKANSLSGCGVDGLTGGEIALLACMRFECPEYFYKCLQDMLHVKDLLTMSKIVWALNDLPEHK